MKPKPFFLKVGRHVRFHPGDTFLRNSEKKREWERKENVQRDEKETLQTYQFLGYHLITVLNLLTSAFSRDSRNSGYGHRVRPTESRQPVEGPQNGKESLEITHRTSEEIT